MRESEVKRWYWYFAQPHELFLDLDTGRALYFAIVNLRRNIRRGFLRPFAVWLFPTLRPGHHHMIIQLRQILRPAERAVWEAHLGSDLKRMAYNIMRSERGLLYPNLLIAVREYGIPGHPADATCTCKGKHKRRSVTTHCRILRKIHGEEAGAEYFAINRDKRKRTGKLRLPYGRVPISAILKY